MNNLEPRAKIGDVVIVEIDFFDGSTPSRIEYKIEDRTRLHGGKGHGQYAYNAEGGGFFLDDYILKNLTTNTVYER